MIVWHGENFNIGIFSDTIDVINVKLCMMVLLIELYLFIPLSMTLATFQGATVTALTDNVFSYPIKLKLHDC